MRICTEAMAPVRECTHVVTFLFLPQTPRGFLFVRWNLAKRGHARIVVDVMARLNPPFPFRLLTIVPLKRTFFGFDWTSFRFERRTDPEQHPTTESSTTGCHVIASQSKRRICETLGGGRARGSRSLGREEGR